VTERKEVTLEEKQEFKRMRDTDEESIVELRIGKRTVKNPDIYNSYEKALCFSGSLNSLMRVSLRRIYEVGALQMLSLFNSG
jgi:hypothetical protein